MKVPIKREFKKQGLQRASALVTTLALVTILTLILLTYFSIVRTDRLATRNYAQGIKADETARGALDFILGQLREEMADGQVPLTVGSQSIFTNLKPENILPGKVGAQADLPVLIKKSSAGIGIYPAAPNGFKAIAAQTSTGSANGRRVTVGRWARPGLGKPDQAPSWFLVGEQGIAQSATADVQGRFAFTVYDLGSLVDINVAGHPASLNTAQTREIQGSLAGLDLAGMPGMDATTSDDLILNFRNTASGASAGSYVDYVLGEGAESGFVTVAAGDDKFLSRQDFLAYAKLKGIEEASGNLTTFTRTLNAPSWAPSANPGDIPVHTLKRSNVAQWNPKSGAAISNTVLPFKYKDLATDATGTNRNFLSQVVTGNFTRFDGSAAEAGDLLVSKRFPLSRLAWLSKDGPSAEAIDEFGTAAKAAEKIKAAFGLVWDSTNRLWVYTSPASAHGGGTYVSGNSDGPASSAKAANTIKTLATVASENREPDFFELLQAGILKGSLGERTSIANPDNIPLPGEVTPEGHVLQIGANMIDQYDSDDYPTLIRAYMPVVMDASEHAYDWATTTSYVLGTGNNALTICDFAGVENLPYLMSFRTRAYRPQAGNTSDGARRVGEGILMPQFWNPHQNAAALASDRPAKLRVIQTFGEIRMVFMGNKRGSTAGTPYIDSVTGDPFGYVGYQTSPPSAWPSATGAPQPSIAFAGSRTFAQPGFLAPADVTDSSIPQNIQTAITGDAHTKGDVDAAGFVGFWLGRTPAPGTTIVADDPADEADDNTPVDREVWALFTGQPIQDCPVQQYISSVACPVRRNPSALPAGDRFWKGDSTLANYNYRWPVFELQYLDGTVWKTYQRFDGVLRGGGDDHKWDTYSTTFTPSGKYAASFTSESFASMYCRIDPRGNRFGLVRSDDPSSLYGGAWNGNPLSFRNTPFAGLVGTTGRPNGEAVVNFNGTNLEGNQSGASFTNAFNPSSDSTRYTTYPYWEWINNLVAGQRYTDNDTVLRRGDANSAAGVNPLNLGTPASPVMLNRAFTSVGDLGYVHRDLPFKTLDFFSANSADAGLLDIFCLNESPVAVAGKVNLNGKNATVVAAILKGAVKEESSGTALSTTETGKIATALVTRSEARPFVGIWDLADFIGGTDYGSATTGNLKNVKTQMETATRRLAQVADVRCWNLMIDVVAQTGRFAPGAGPSDFDRFIVEGERRYWLSIAIDRFTGQVVDRQLEPVFE